MAGPFLREGKIQYFGGGIVQKHGVSFNHLKSKATVNLLQGTGIIVTPSFKIYTHCILYWEMVWSNVVFVESSTLREEDVHVLLWITLASVSLTHAQQEPNSLLGATWKEIVIKLHRNTS